MNQISLVNNLTTQSFTSQFGAYSAPFPYVSPDGSATWNVMLFIVGGIFMLIGGSIMTITSNDKDKENNSNQNLSNYLLFILGITFMSGGAFLGIEGSIRYIWEYLPQYNNWFNSLPQSGKNAYMQMKAIQQVMSNITQK